MGNIHQDILSNRGETTFLAQSSVLGARIMIWGDSGSNPSCLSHFWRPTISFSLLYDFSFREFDIATKKVTILSWAESELVRRFRG